MNKKLRPLMWEKIPRDTSIVCYNVFGQYLISKNGIWYDVTFCDNYENGEEPLKSFKNITDAKEFAFNHYKQQIESLFIEEKKETLYNWNDPEIPESVDAIAKEGNGAIFGYAVTIPIYNYDAGAWGGPKVNCIPLPERIILKNVDSSISLERRPKHE